MDFIFGIMNGAGIVLVVFAMILAALSDRLAGWVMIAGAVLGYVSFLYFLNFAKREPGFYVVLYIAWSALAIAVLIQYVYFVFLERRSKKEFKED